jgi:hypothetical protein
MGKLMRNLEELDVRDAGRIRRPPPTDGQISLFEKVFDIMLPPDYVAFLRHRNGGSPRLGCFRPDGFGENEYYGIAFFCYLSDDSEDLEGLWEWTRTWRAMLSAKIVAIADDGGGNGILLWFEDGQCHVKLCLRDENYSLVNVNSSFSGFVDMLFRPVIDR